MAIWNRITAFVTGGAVATAAADALKPEFEVLQQTAWANEPHKVLPPGTAAELRARQTQAGTPGIDLQGVNLADDAARSGVGSNRFDLLTELARTWPGVGELIRLRRRGIATDNANGITDAEMTEALRRSGLTAEMISAIHDLVAERLDPEKLAAAIHRGLIPDPGLLKGETPEGPFTVEQYPVYPIDALAEAEAAGIDRTRLGVEVGLQGFPMGPIEAANAYFRGDITYGDYIQAFNLSNNRNEWAKATLAYARQIPTARDYIENALRGYRTFADAAKGAARHGMSEEDARLIFQNSGRPLNLHQITQALAYGAKYNPLPGDDPDPYMNAVLIGPVTPAYYEMQDTLKYNLPSAFFFRVLQEQGVLTNAEAETWYKRLGWPPELASKVAEAFGTATTGTANKWVTSAERSFFTTTHNSYKNAEMDGSEARNNLAQLGITGDSANEIVQLWEYERETIRKQLTPAQLVKAFKKAAENPATAQPYTRQDVIDRLIGMGYLYNDAVTLLDESL